MYISPFVLEHVHVSINFVLATACSCNRTSFIFVAVAQRLVTFCINMHHHMVIHVMFVGHLCIGIREFSPAEVLAATGNFGACWKSFQGQISSLLHCCESPEQGMWTLCGATHTSVIVL